MYFWTACAKIIVTTTTTTTTTTTIIIILFAQKENGQSDLMWYYKIVFGLVDLNFDDFLNGIHTVVEDKLYKKSTRSHVRSNFF